MTYNAEFGGYIADVPKVVFHRCDGKTFAMDELSSASVTADQGTIDINGGWSLFQVAILPGQSTFTMNFTSVKFEAEMFSTVNKADFNENNAYAMDAIEYHEPDTNHKITLLQTPIADSVKINGLEETAESTVAEGKFKVDATNKTVEFCATDVINKVKVVYQYEDSVQEAIMTNKESAIGEAVCIWPVFGSGDDCTESNIIGYVIVRVFRARVSTMPGFDTSYKTGAEFSFELTALDAKRNDDGAWSLAYKRVA